MKLRVSILSLVICTACGDFPEFDHEGKRHQGANQDRPRILPVEGLMIMAIGPRPGSSSGIELPGSRPGGIEARLARLQRRAALLRGAPVNETTRGRLSRQ